jgi:predicted esterase
MRLYLTGRGGELDKGLGRHLADRSPAFDGIAFNQRMLQRPFTEQVARTRNLLQKHWDRRTELIANSYGCYILLHALTDQGIFPGKILMLSPLLGRTELRAQGFSSRPPMLKALNRAFEQKRIAKPAYLNITAGNQDPICEQAELEWAAKTLSADRLELLEGEGHLIAHSTMERVLDRFFGHVIT